MIRIERLQLHLPAGFEHRAQGVARRLGELLGRQGVSQDVTISALRVIPQRIPRNTSDEDIAKLIADDIIAAYPGGQQ